MWVLLGMQRHRVLWQRGPHSPWTAQGTPVAPPGHWHKDSARIVTAHLQVNSHGRVLEGSW